MKNICPACGEEYYKEIKFYIDQGKRGRIGWLKCDNCRSFFSAAKYDKDVEKLYTSINTSWGSEVKGVEVGIFKDRMYNSIAVSIKKKYPPPADLLDVGCSYGGFLNTVKKLGYNVEGFDIVSKAVKYVVDTLKIKAAECFSISEFDQEEIKKIDIITVLDCNCYWENQKKELEEIYKRIKDDGIIVMRVVDKSKYLVLGKFISRISPFLGKLLMRYSVNDHRFSMPLNSLLTLLKSIGFKTEYISSVDAIYSTQTKWFVKLLFASGTIIRLLTGINLSPGLVLIARKTK